MDANEKITTITVDAPMAEVPPQADDVELVTAQADDVALVAVPVIRVSAFYFASFAFFATSTRFLTLFFQADGFHATDIGVLRAVSLVIGTIMTPIWALLADKTKRARSFVLIAVLAGMAPFLALSIPLGASRSKFWSRAIPYWLYGLCTSPQGALMDALARAASGQDVDRWGKARIWGAIGWGAMHLFLGPLIDSIGFSALWISFIILGVVCCLVTRISVPEACGKVQQDVTPRAVVEIFLRNKLFFFNIMAIGGGFSMVEGMLFLLLDEMHASTMLCGMSVVVTVLFEIPIFANAEKLLAYLGAPNMILLAQAAWVVRAFFYAYMPYAWMVLLIEPLHGVTFALVWTAATQYVADPAVSGYGLEASAQGLLQFTFHGVGPVFGLLIGGALFDSVGSHAAYAIFAVLVLAIGLVYAYHNVGRIRTQTSSKLPTSSTSSENIPVTRDDVRVIGRRDSHE